MSDPLEVDNIYNESLGIENGADKVVAEANTEPKPTPENGPPNMIIRSLTNSSGPGDVQGGKRIPLLVGQLNWWTSDKDLLTAVENIGVNDVIDIRFFENRANGQSKGFAVVAVRSEASSKLLFDQLPGMEIGGNQPIVTFCNKAMIQQFGLSHRDQQPSGERGGRISDHGGHHGLPRPGSGFPHQPQHSQPSATMEQQQHPSIQPLMSQPLRPPNPMRPPLQQQPTMNPMMSMQQPRPPLQMQQQMPPQPLPAPRMPSIQPLLQQQQPPQLQPQSSQPPMFQRPPMSGMMPPSSSVPGMPPPGSHINPAFYQNSPVQGQRPPLQPQQPPVSLPMQMPPPQLQHPGGQMPPVGGAMGTGSMPSLVGSQGPGGMPAFSGAPGPLQTSSASAGSSTAPTTSQAPAQPAMSEREFDEILQRNKTVSSSAISRAVQDASVGDYAGAIETLVTAISLIKQSRIADDDRCRILISSLQDTLRGIEDKSYGQQKYSRSGRRNSRSPDRSARSSHRSRSRERSDYRSSRDDRYDDRDRYRDRDRRH